MGPLGFLMTLMDTVEVATLEGDRLSYAVTLNCNRKKTLFCKGRKKTSIHCIHEQKSNIQKTNSETNAQYLQMGKHLQMLNKF